MRAIKKVILEALLARYFDQRECVNKCLQAEGRQSQTYKQVDEIQPDLELPFYGNFVYSETNWHDSKNHLH